MRLLEHFELACIDYKGTLDIYNQNVEDLTQFQKSATIATKIALEAMETGVGHWKAMLTIRMESVQQIYNKLDTEVQGRIGDLSDIAGVMQGIKELQKDLTIEKNELEKQIDPAKWVELKIDF